MADLEQLKHAPASTGILDVIAKRWSPRAFTSQQVSKEDLRTIFTAAEWAASSFNEQPWRFILGIRDDEQHGEAYNKIFDALVESNQQWAKSAPVLIATIAKKTFSHNGTPNRVAQHDVGAASATMCLQAIALGIHTHGMAGFDPEALRASFGIPSNFEPMACWAMGYLGNPDTLPEHLKEQELAPRTRKNLDEFVFTDWETGAEF
ncbi:MAG: nitroreductase family protein [Acidobacteria bacterium]|nr:nitroreductase family protein [Acidobacteriota bacterium]